MIQWLEDNLPHRGPSEVRHSLSGVGRLTSTKRAYEGKGLGPNCNRFRFTRKGITAYTHLKQFMDKDTGFVHHSNIQWTPILEERHIKQVVVDREVIVCRIVVWRCRRTTSWACTDGWSITWLHRQLVKHLGVRRRMRKRGKVKPAGSSTIKSVATQAEYMLKQGRTCRRNGTAARIWVA
jgi:hypothetical protein